MPFHQLIWGTICSFGLIANTAHADFVLNNLSEATVGTAAVNGPLALASLYGVKFSVGPGTWDLTAITARMTNDVGLFPPPIQLRVVSDNSDTPGGIVFGTFDPASNLGGDLVFNSSGNFTWTGGTDYWLVGFPTTDAALFGWGVTTSGNDNGAAGWSLANYSKGSADSGFTWSPALPAVPQVRFNATQQVFSPEPSSLLLIGVLLVMASYPLHRRLREPAPPLPR